MVDPYLFEFKSFYIRLLNDRYQFYFRTGENAAAYLAAIKNTMPCKAIVDKACFVLSNDDFNLLRKKCKDSIRRSDPSTYLIKTLRGDRENFFNSFKLMITRSPTQQIRFPLRKGVKKQFTVKGTGIEDRYTRRPQYTPVEKMLFSQPNSTTLIIPNYTPNLFKFASD